jgi:hypothetical protein
VGVLRTLAGIGASGPLDAWTGRYLLSTGSVAQRDLMARAIHESGMPADDQVAIEAAFVTLCAAPRRAWRRARLDPSTGMSTAVPSAPVLDSAVLETLRSDAAALPILRPRAPAGGADHGRAIRDVRRLARLGNDGPHDRLIGDFLLEDRDNAPAPAELWDAGVDPLDLYELERIVKELESTCSPHSVLAVSAQRPSRPCPGAVQCVQPIES